jgi:hypothetical protein
MAEFKAASTSLALHTGPVCKYRVFVDPCPLHPITSYPIISYFLMTSVHKHKLSELLKIQCCMLYKDTNIALSPIGLGRYSHSRYSYTIDTPIRP